MAERRNKTRRSAAGYYVVFDVQKDQPLGKVVNLSEDGMMLTSSDPVEIDRLYNCRMALPDQLLDRRLIIFEARSIWSRRNDLANVYQTGYQFQEVSPKDMEVLRLLIQSWAVETPGTAKTVIDWKSCDK